MRAGALAGLGDRGGEIVGRGGEDDVLAFDLVDEFGREDVDLAQLDIVVARHALQARGIAVGHGQPVVAGRGQQFGDGDADFSAADEHDFFHGNSSA